MNEADVKELVAWKESALKQLGKADALKEILPPQYLGWDVYDAVIDYVGNLRRLHPMVREALASALESEEDNIKWIPAAIERLTKEKADPRRIERYALWEARGVEAIVQLRKILSHNADAEAAHAL